MPKATKFWLSLAALAALLLATGAACGSDSAQDVSYADVSPQELNSMLESKDFLFVNVHIPYEGEIADTDLFLPFDEIADRLDELASGQDAKIVLYCRSGNMSATAANVLAGLGYTNVSNLDGGMVGWEEAGYLLADTQP